MLRLRAVGDPGHRRRGHRRRCIRAVGQVRVGTSRLPDAPKWILRLAKRHRPANVGYQQLERAWRNTKGLTGTFLCAYGVSALACFFGFVVKVPTVALACSLLAVAVYIVGVCYMMKVRRNFWLGRAIALAGAQPALGYAGLARLPGITKITATLGAVRVVTVIIIVARVFLTDDKALSVAVRDGSWALYFVFFIVLSGWNLRQLADAHKALAARLTVRR